MGDDSAARLREPPVSSVEPVGDTIVVHLRGELDLYNADELRSAFSGAIDGGATRLVVDLDEVEFIDSTALGVLLEVRARLAPGGLLLACPRVEIRRTLMVSGLDRHLPVHDSIDQALAS